MKSIKELSNQKFEIYILAACFWIGLIILYVENIRLKPFPNEIELINFIILFLFIMSFIYSYFLLKGLKIEGKDA